MTVQLIEVMGPTWFVAGDMRSIVSVGIRARLARQGIRAALVPVAGGAAENSAFFQMAATPLERSSSDPDSPVDALAGSATHYMRFRIPKPEAFYFGRENSGGVCRLCNEYVNAKNVHFHLIASGSRGSSLHMAREIVLDSLVHHAKAGRDPAVVLRAYAHILVECPNYVRIPELLPPDISDLTARAGRVTALLRYLQSERVLDIAVNPHSEPSPDPVISRLAVKRRLAFERLECVGDNAWGSHLAGRMMLLFADKQWNDGAMYHSFNTFRDLAETNTNLERMFDVLQLQTLLPPALRELVGDGKIKADVFEAVLGELSMKLYGHESLLHNSEEYTEPAGDGTVAACTLVRHVLTEIHDLTLLCLVSVLGEHAAPIALELALGSLLPTFKPSFDAGASVRTRRPQYREGFCPTFVLPERPSVYPTALRVSARDAARHGPCANRQPPRCHPVWNAVWALRPLSRQEVLEAAEREQDVDGEPRCCPPASPSFLTSSVSASAPLRRHPFGISIPGLLPVPTGTSLLRRGTAVATCPLLASAVSVTPLNPYATTEQHWREMWLNSGEALFDETVDATVVLAQYEASCALQPPLPEAALGSDAPTDADNEATTLAGIGHRDAVCLALRGFPVGSGGASTRGLTSATAELDLEQIKRRNAAPRPS